MWDHADAEGEEGPQGGDRDPVVSASVTWAGTSRRIQGRARGDFVSAHGQLLVRLDDLSGAVADGMGRSLWVFTEDIVEPESLILRSEIWELPGEGERDFVLRTFLGTLGELVRDFGEAVAIGRDAAHGGEGGSPFRNGARSDAGLGGGGRPGADTVEWTLTLEVPPAALVDYLAALLPSRRRCAPRDVPWRPPRDIMAQGVLTSEKERTAAAYHLSHLPGWLESRRFWSVLQWSGRDGKLRHHIQFSLPERYRRTLQQRFRLR